MCSVHRNFDELSRSVSLNVQLVDSEATAEAETVVARKGEDFAHYAARNKVFTAAQLIAHLERLMEEGANYFIFYLPRTAYDLSQLLCLGHEASDGEPILFQH